MNGIVLVIFFKNIVCLIMNDLLDFKELVIRYLQFLIAEDFNKSHDLLNDVIFTENIISKKTIIVQNFSEQINSNPDLKKYLEAVINNINLRLTTEKDMYKTLQ